MNRSLFAVGGPASLRRWAALLVLVGVCATGWASGDASPSIYTCVDAGGRRLTSDRPIPACLDREQRELNRDGSVRRVLPPVLSAVEREARQARQREAELARQRQQEQVRRDRALYLRYPDAQTHSQARREALQQTQAVIDLAEQRIADLARERKAIDDELEFYKNDPSRAPAQLRRARSENELAVEAQRRAITGQHEERRRINTRFDDELLRLQPLWGSQTAVNERPAPR